MTLDMKIKQREQKNWDTPNIVKILIKESSQSSSRGMRAFRQGLKVPGLNSLA